MGLKAGASCAHLSSFSAHASSSDLPLFSPLIATFLSPFLSLPPFLPSSVQLYSPEATISNVFTHNVCLPNIVDERMDGWSRSLGSEE